MPESKNLVIIGSGPAGYSAAIYAARGQLEPVVVAGEKSGGQLMLTTEVENYAGFPDGIMGPELMMGMRKQAERFGAVMVDKFVTAVDFSARPFKIWTNYPEGRSPYELAMSGSEEEMRQAIEEIKQAEPAYEAEAVILATGAIAKMLHVPGEMDYIGRGVSYCAVCDAAFYRDKKVFLVGGGDAAMEDALALVKFAREVNILVRRDSLRASKVMQKRVVEEHKDQVNIWWNTQVQQVLGDGKVMKKLKVLYNNDNKEEEVEADGLFVAIGHKPMTRFLGNEVAMDEKGYVITRLGLEEKSVKLAGEHLGERGLVRFPTMTSVGGVFAGGDNVDFRYRQAITAAAYGTMAALDAEWWLER